MSTIHEVRVPDIGDFDEVPVIELLVSVGDRVEPEQSLLTLESDKATMDVPSPVSGVVRELKVAVGDEVSEGTVIALVEVEDAAGAGDEGAREDHAPAADDAAAQADEHRAQAAGEGPSRPGPADEVQETVSDSGSAHTQAAEASDRREALPPPPVPFAEMQQDPASLPLASPAVRKLARELGVDLKQVQGSGRNGRITEEDLKSWVKGHLSAAPAGSATGLALAPAPEIDFSSFGQVEVKPLSRIQKISGPNLHRNWVTIPHVTQFDEADITEMEAFRKAAQAEAEARGTKMTPLVFLIKAVVGALKHYPKFNTSLSPDGQHLVWKQYYHIGVAVDTPGGLVVPVIRDADQQSLLELAEELTRLSGKAREGKLSRDEMTGGCLTISSLGGIGGTAFTPIINAPEVAILGVSRAQMKPVWNGKKFKPRLMLPLSLSYDHRVIDGADAARFTRHLAYLLEDLRRLML
ncbi:MAG: dihydrolipoyllysine-residue acetyltransferase [Wenzhouxiangellaceae bacterium]